LLIRNVVNLLVFDGATANNKRRDAVIAVNMETTTPTTKTSAKPVMTAVLPNA
jgi:hypothetical protein